eukprot:202661_1
MSSNTENKEQGKALDSVDIGVFYGIRVLMSIGVAMIHTVFVCYMLLLPANMLPEQPPPVAPWKSSEAFFRSLIGSSFTWLMHGGINVFWFISGFLISYQLYFIPRHHYHYFIFNRLLRLYPLYMIQVFGFYFFAHSPNCSTLWHICRALLFIDNFWESAMDSTCSGTGWSLSIEMQSCVIIVALFYLLDPVRQKTKIIFIFCAIFIASWIASIYMFDIHCRPYTKFDDFEGSLIRVGIDTYYPDQWRLHSAPNDPFADMDKSMYDPDHLTADQIRNQKLYNNYYSSLNFPSYTQIGGSFFGAISCLQLLSIGQQSKGVKYGYVLMFFVANFCLQCLYSMVTLIKDVHLRWFEFTDSVFASVLLGSPWKIAQLSVFCGMNVLLRLNNTFVNAALNNAVTRFFSKFTYGVFLFHMYPQMAFTLMDQEHRKALYSASEIVYDGSYIMSVFNKSYAIALAISVVLYYVVEYPISGFGKSKIASVFKKKLKPN